MRKNIWQRTSDDAKTYPGLSQTIETEICIVGGGITGITAALQLCRAGKKVVILEAERLAFGTTGSSSNHLNTQIDFSYHKIEKNFSEEIAQLVASARTDAINYIEKNATSINADFRRVDGYLYTETEDQVETLEKEYEASLRAGLPVVKSRDVPLPFPIRMAIKYSNQGAFNSIKYINGLANEVTSMGGIIFENSRVIDFDKDTVTLTTAHGSVKAKEVFFATHIPLFINLHQTTSSPYRSFIITAKVDNYPEDALYWDTFDPYHYTRIYEENGDKWLVVGGADHKTGHSDPDKDYYKDLEIYLQRRYRVKEITHRWSHQYFETADGLPYIGKSPLGTAYMATGYSGDGLVYGTIAGILVSDMILGKENEWEKAFDARRFKPVASAGSFIEHNIDVAKQLIAGRFTSDDLKELTPDTGVVIRKDGDNYAVYKNPDGRLTVCSAICTHMKCVVNWNHMEKIWECGCHGSHFAADGKVLMGPATKDLSKIGEEKAIKEFIKNEEHKE